MKTKLFLSEKIEESDIEKIKNLQEVKPELFLEIKNWFLEQNEHPRINTKLTVKFAESTNSSAEEVINTVNSIYWLNLLLNDYSEDTPEDIIEDLKLINPDCIINEETLYSRFKDVGEIASKFSLFVKSQRTKGYGAPTLKGSNSTIIIKPVIDKRFVFDEQDIKDYKPNILKNEICVLIELQDSNNKNFSFQTDAENFERFLNDLIALQIELNTVKNDIS